MISNTQMKIVGNLALIDKTLFEIETAADTNEIERMTRVKDPSALRSFYSARANELQAELEGIRDKFDAAQISRDFIASMLEQPVDRDKTLEDALAAFEAERAARERRSLLTQIPSAETMVSSEAAE